MALATAASTALPGPEAPWPGQHLLRFLCVIGMILVHAFTWLGSSTGRLMVSPQAFYYPWLRWSMVVGILPLLLPFTAGCALGLRLPAPQRFTARIFGRVMAGSLALAALGVAMNVLAAGWYARWAWNVLPFVALSFVVLAVLLLLRSPWPPTLAGVLCFLVSDPLRAAAPVGEQRDGWSRILLGDPLDFHSWPFLPWFGIVVAGWLVARTFVATGGDRRFRWGLSAAGGAIVAAVAGIGQVVPTFDATNLVGPAVMQLPALSAVGLTGVAMGLTAILTAAGEGRTFRRLGVVLPFSYGILWIYIVHMVVGLRLSRFLFRHLDQAALVDHPGTPLHLAVIIGFPTLLIAVGWLVGVASIRWLQGKWIDVRVRRVARARA